MNTLASQKGAVLLFTVLIVGLASVAIMSSLALAGLNSFVDASQQQEAMETRAEVLGCVHELLIQFNKDPNFSPLTIATVDAVCTVSVVNEGGDARSADVSITEDGITRTVHVEFTVNGVSVTSIQEQ